MANIVNIRHCAPALTAIEPKSMRVSDEQLQEAMSVQDTGNLTSSEATNLVVTLVEGSHTPNCVSPAPAQ